LIRSLSREGYETSLVAFGALTKLDVVSKLALLARIEWDPEGYRTVKQDVLHQVLISSGEVFANLARHPESLATVSRYTEQFDWIELDDTLVQNVSSAGQAVATKISLELLQVVREVQHRLSTIGKLSPGNVISLLSNSPSEAVTRQAKEIFGHVLVVASDYPSSLSNLLDQILDPDSQHKVNLIRGDSRVQETEVLSYPDPETEAKAVVRAVAERIAAGDAIDQFAVLYTDAAQYADLLENEFDQAQIAWNGMATESAVLSLPATATKGYLKIANSIFESGTFSRGDLIALLRVSSISCRGNKFGSGTFVRFLNRNGLFNETSNWGPLLSAMVAQIASLEGELRMLVDVQAEQDEIDDITFKLNQAESAKSLVGLIDELHASAARLSKSKTNFELAAGVWTEVNDFFPQLAEAKMPIDRLTFAKMSELFGAQHTTELTSQGEIKAALNQIGEVVMLKLAALKMQHGELSRGVYVGPVSQNGALYFENLWIVGAGEGMLPPQINEDPIFPDSLKDIITQQTGFEFKSVVARASEIEANFHAVTTGSKNLAISYPRGGTLSKSEGMPSAWLEGFLSSPVKEVPSAFEFRLNEQGAVSSTDLHSKESAALSDAEAKSKQLAAAIWFASPQPNEFAGNLGGTQSEPLLDFDQMSLSASSVEKFLKCGHNFFTVKVLGLSDMEEPDSIDEIRAIDFGKAVHAAFERLLKEFPQLNPSFGERYSDEAIAKFRDLFNEECDLLVARGQAGWPPLFEARRRGFIEFLGEYFTLEHRARSEVYVAHGNRGQFRAMSDENLLKPQNAEFEFDKTGNGLLQVPVQVEGYPQETLRFKGLIDRVDVSADREHVGVIDFKTGSKKYIDKGTAVQDLLYEYAIRRNSNFLGVTKVSSRYLFLAKNLESSGLVSLRNDRELGVFLHPNDGGLTGQEYFSGVAENRAASERDLHEKLKLLVEASYGRVFRTHDVESAKGSIDLCPTCKKLGQKTITRLSPIAHPKHVTEQTLSDEGEE
jgi:RecB family exonuclease